MKKYWDYNGYKDRYTHIFIVGFILLLSFQLISPAISNLLLIPFALYTFYYAYRFKIKPRIHPLSYWFFLLFALMILSCFWSIDTNATKRQLLGEIRFFSIPLLFAFIPSLNQSDRKFILNIFTFILAVLSLVFIFIGLYRYVKTDDFTFLSQHPLVNPLNLNRVIVSLFVSTTIFHLILNYRKNFLWFLEFSVLSIFLLLLSSKAIIISSLVIFLFVLNIRKKFKFLLILFLFPLVIGLSLKINKGFISEMIPRYHEILHNQHFGKGYYFNGAELRLLYTRFLIELNKEDKVFFTGYGLNTSQSKIKEKIVQYNVYPDYGEKYNFHNQFNLYMAEIGIFGVLLLLIIFGKSYVYALKNKDTFLTIFLLLFTVFLITDTPLYRQPTFFLFMYILFISLNMHHDSNQNSLKKEML